MVGALVVEAEAIHKATPTLNTHLWDRLKGYVDRDGLNGQLPKGAGYRGQGIGHRQ